SQAGWNMMSIWLQLDMHALDGRAGDGQAPPVVEDVTLTTKANIALASRLRRGAALGAVLDFMLSRPIAAPDDEAKAAPSEEQVAQGLTLWKDNGWFNCHGEYGEGGEGGHFPAGPSLRATSLDAASLHEVIACGIPGTLMPYNVAGA